MTGDPRLEQTIRAHANTAEWMPLPSLWLLAVYWSSSVAAVLGLVWVAGRIAYFADMWLSRRSAFRDCSFKPSRSLRWRLGHSAC
jgi:uncharacterized membrane protein YecN with MAPEG domain